MYLISIRLEEEFITKNFVNNFLNERIIGGNSYQNIVTKRSFSLYFPRLDYSPNPPPLIIDSRKTAVWHFCLIFL